MLLLKMIVVPLVFFSIFCGVSSLGDITHIGRLGKRTVIYYAATTFIAVIIGLILVNIIRPGDNMVAMAEAGKKVPAAVSASKDMGIGKMLLDQVSAFFINPF